MRYSIVVLWALIVGQVISYIGGALNHQAYNPLTTAGISFLAGLCIIVLGFIIQPSQKKKNNR